MRALRAVWSLRGIFGDAMGTPQGAPRTCERGHLKMVLGEPELVREKVVARVAAETRLRAGAQAPGGNGAASIRAFQSAEQLRCSETGAFDSSYLDSPITLGNCRKTKWFDPGQGETLGGGINTCEWNGR